MSFFIVACDSLADSSTPSEPEGQANSNVIPTAVNTPEIETNTGDTTEIAEATKEPVRELRVWTINEIAPNPDTTSGQLLSDQLSRFASNHPAIDLVVEQKTPTGPASLPSYLDTGSNIAPDILPDLALIPAFQLPELVQQGQIFPISGLIPTADLEDLLPVGQQMGRVGDEFYGYPYATTGMHHAIYNSSAITTTLSTDWDTLISSENTFVFPASSASGIQLLLQFYLAEGGTLRNETGQIQLELAPLQQALQTLQNGRESGFIRVESGVTTTEDEAWLFMINGQATLAQTSVTQYFAQRAQGTTFAFAPLPGNDTALVPQVSGWVWVITTADPARQALASELLLWLVNGPNMGDWSLQSQYLPPRYAAYERWGNDPYVTFLRDELERSAMLPTTVSGAVSDALDQALQSLFATPSPNIPAIAQAAVAAVK